jgi:peptide/nickel transport system ATP-binding protein
VQTLAQIDGSPPDLHTPPEGCRFAPRCPFALQVCRETMPPRMPVAEGHVAACHRTGEAAVLRDAAAEPATWH